MEQNVDAYGAALGVFGWWIIGLLLVPWIAVIIAAHDRGNSMLGAAFIGLFGTPLIGLLYVIAQPVNQSVLDERAIRSGKLTRCSKCLSPRHPSAALCPQCATGDHTDAPSMRSHPPQATSSYRPPTDRPAPASSGAEQAPKADAAPMGRPSDSSQASRGTTPHTPENKEEHDARPHDPHDSELPRGMTVNEETFERAETDTSATDEFRRKMEQRRD